MITTQPAKLTPIAHQQHYANIRFLKQGNEQSYSAFGTNCQAVMLTANAEGDMSAGALLELSMFDAEASMEYMDLCVRRQVYPGIPCIIASRVRPDFWYILMPLKGTFEDAPEGRHLRSCLECLQQSAVLADLGILCIATTMLGCGRGAKNLKKREVLSTMLKHLTKLPDVHWDVHVPEQMALTPMQVAQLVKPESDPWQEAEDMAQQEAYARERATSRATEPAAEIHPSWVMPKLVAIHS